MGGGLMQLVAYGAQDIYLTGNPQITFFKVVYRRHTNFSMESIQQTVNGSALVAGTANNGTVTISRNGDLVHKIYVQTSEVVGINAGWEIVNEVELEIGGQKIDKHDRTYLACMNELTTPESKALALKAMTGSTGTTGTIAAAGTGVNVVQIPLQFWFCKNPGLALPLIALQYHEVKLKFRWGVTGDVGGTGCTCNVYCDYIYLDTDERRRFAQQSHEYLIEQVQRETRSGMGVDEEIKLNFNHPVKEIIWTSTAATANHYTSAQIKLNGHDRFSAMPMEYFQLRQPLDHHTAVPRVNLPTAARNSLLDRQVRFETINRTAADGLVSTQAFTALDTAGAVAGNFTIDAGPVLQLGMGADTTATTFGEAGTALIAGTQLAIVCTESDDDGAGGGAPLTQGTGGRVYFCNLTADANIAGTANAIILNITTPTTAEATPLTLAVSAVAADPAIFQVFVVSNVNSAQARTSGFNERINVYSFAFKPEEHQPSGTCNFSRIDTAKLKFTGASPHVGGMEIYAINYNVLRIMSGMGGLAYSN